MNFDSLKEYFELYIIKYLPHKEKPLYQQVANFLLSFYYDTYNEIPNGFKLAYENQTIPDEFIDPLLISNGFPEIIIKKLNLKYKNILLQSFMDFNRYKGTIYSFKKISSSFDDVFNIYELFLSRDTVHNKWVFLPYLIYKHPNLEDNLSNLKYDFNEIANKTKYFLIDESNLDIEYSNNNLVLPIKTNLILLDYHSNYTHTAIVPLLNAIILNHFKDYKIIISFFDGEYKTSLIKFLALWHYIFYKLYNRLHQNQLQGSYLFFNPVKLNFNFFLKDLVKIENEYNNIQSRSDLEIFIEKYLSLFNKKDVNFQSQTNAEVLETLVSNIPTDLLDYINARLVDRFSAHDILTEMYNSLITWSYTLYINNPSFQKDYSKFIDIFIAQLPFIYQSLLDSSSYLLIDHFKPYHAEIVLNENYGLLKIQDKFNRIFLDDRFKLDLGRLKTLSLAHQSSFFVHRLSNKDFTSVPIIHNYNFYANNNPI